MRIGNPFRRVQAEKQGQASAGGCNRLIKKGIPCWNYLYLNYLYSSQQLAEADDAAALRLAALIR